MCREQVDGTKVWVLFICTQKNIKTTLEGHQVQPNILSASLKGVCAGLQNDLLQFDQSLQSHSKPRWFLWFASDPFKLFHMNIYYQFLNSNPDLWALPLRYFASVH